MAGWNELPPEGLDAAAGGDAAGGDTAAYRDGYARVMREMSWARAHGWMPTERQLVLALSQAGKVYATVRGGRSIGGRRPEWVHGRVDALRALLRHGVGALPQDRAGAE